MSIILMDSKEIWYDDTENVCQMDIYVDDASDLTSLTHLDGIKFLQGSKAKDISTGDKYILNSVGNWVLQPFGISLDLSGYYTSAETDTLLSGKQDSLSASQMNAVNSGITSSIVTTTTAVLPELVNDGAKNEINLYGYTYYASDVGVHVDANSSMELDCSGTCLRDIYIALKDIQLTAGKYVLSGIQETTTSNTYFLSIEGRNGATGAAIDYGSGSEFIAGGGEYRVYLRIKQGINMNDKKIKPMVCTKAKWDISNSFVTYGMTNDELSAVLPDIVDAGAKNMIKFYATATAGGGTATINPNGYSVTMSGSSSVTGMKMADIVGLENETYIFKYETTGTTGSALVIYDNTSSSNFRILNIGSGEIEIANFDPTHIYSLNNYVGTATTLSGTVSAMLCKKSLYAISNKYVPYIATIYDAYNA